MNSAPGFTFVELLISISVIGILAAVVIAPLSQSGAHGRDSERKADLRTIQSALEAYKNDNGRYPEGCNVGPGDAGDNAAWTGGTDYISGQIGSGYECAGGSAEYIIGLAPRYVPVLPTDPKLNDNFSESGYIYITNPAGTVYKIMALNTVETEIMTIDDETQDNPFSRCGDLQASNVAICQSVPSTPTGNQPYNTAGITPTQCQDSNEEEWGNDFALSGGFAPGGGNPYRDIERAREYYSDYIHCW